MKIVYQNVVWLLFFVAFNYNSLAKYDEDPVKLDVAAFFYENNSQAEIAFETAIFNANMMQSDFHYTANSKVILESDNFENSDLLCNITETSQLGAVFCPNSRKAASIIESICKNLEIPVFHIDWNSAVKNFETPLLDSDWDSTFNYNGTVAVNFYPYTKLLYQGLGVIVRHLQWRSIVIFYESIGSLIRLQDVLKIQTSDANIKYNSIILKKLGPGPDYRSALKQIQNKSEHRIILDCSTRNIMTVLRQAKELRLLEKPFNYFLTSFDAHTLNFTSLNTEANITTVRIMNPHGKNLQDAAGRWKNYANNHNKTYINLDPFSIKTESAIISDAITTYLTVARKLKVTDNIKPKSLSCQGNVTWENGLTVASFIAAGAGGESSGIITEPIDFDVFGRRTNFNMYVVEGNREDVIAIWNPKDSQRLHFLKSEEDRNKELEEKWSKGVVTVASILGPPYLMEATPEEGQMLEGNKRYKGFSMDLMTELAKKLNISIKFEVFSDGLRGAYDKTTKSWNGLIRQILDRKADLAICDFTITPERREVVDFSTPFIRLGISILYKKPEPKAANMYAFLDPLSIDLWIYSATLYLAISVVLYFIARLSPSDWENPHPCDPEPEELENIWNMRNCHWLTLGSVMNQGCDILPKGICPRMVASMWWFFAIIVTNSYMANLAAFLTNERSQNSINSADDLAKQTKVKYGTMAGGSTESFFRDSNYSVYQRMWTNMQQSKPTVFETTNSDGVARVQNTKNRLYAFLMESATLEYEIYTKCDLMQVGNWLDSKSYGIAMPLDYPHRSRINEALLGLQEKMVINKLKDRWWKEMRDTPLCDEAPDEPASNKLALQNVGGVFIVLAVGIGLAYLVAISEFLWNVRNVSVEEHMSYWEAFKIELKFALNVTVTKKKVKRQASESSGSRSGSAESKGLARSILHGAGSFLHLDVLGRGETPGFNRQTSRHSSRPLD